MRGTAALRLDFEPSLLRVLNSSALKQLDRRLRDRIELERLRKETQNDLVELKDAMAWLVELFDRSAPDDLDPDWLTEVARQAQEKERQAEAQFRPVIAALKGALAPSDDKFEADVQKLFRDGIEVLEGWLAFYHGFHVMLARQAAEGRSAAEILRARPVEGDIDHEAVTREIIERFPKILAALAE